MNMPMPPPPFEVRLAYSTTVSLDVTAPNPTLEESVVRMKVSDFLG